MQRKNNVDVVSALREIALLDEQAAQILAEQNLPCQSVYSSLQAMEKLLKSELGYRINMTNKGLVDVTRVHDLHELGNILIEIVAAHDQRLCQQMQSQLHRIIEVNPPYDLFLPNNVRYPQFNQQSGTYFRIEMSNEDAFVVLDKVGQLKRYLLDLHKL